MKIEFKKVPHNPKEVSYEHASVKIEGTFCKISQSLVKIDAVLQGSTEIDCCRCGISNTILVDEKLDFLLSDGVYSSTESEDLVLEMENGLVDFDEIIQGELGSIKSDYYICDKCQQDGDDFEKEF